MKNSRLFFARSDVGVVFSLTNPSFVPLEMMACACAVVEVASERFDGVLTHGEDAWLVEPNPKSAAEGIVKLLKNSALRESLVKRGTDRTRTMDWACSAQQIEKCCCAMCRNRLAARLARIRGRARYKGWPTAHTKACGTVSRSRRCHAAVTSLSLRGHCGGMSAGEAAHLNRP